MLMGWKDRVGRLRAVDNPAARSDQSPGGCSTQSKISRDRHDRREIEMNQVPESSEDAAKNGTADSAKNHVDSAPADDAPGGSL